MVGGSSRIPLFHRLLKAEFDVKRLNFSIDADEAVARGATLRAAQYCDRVRVSACVRVLLHAAHTAASAH